MARCRAQPGLARFLVPPLVHQSLTALAAIGFGIAAVSPSRTVRLLAPVGTLLAAMILHSLHDTIAHFVVWLVLILVAVIALRARRNLRRLATEELPVCAEHHDITQQDAATTPSTKERRNAVRAERRRHGRGAARVLRRRYNAVMDLAILRRRRVTMDNAQEADERHRILTEIDRLTTTGA